MKVPALLVLGVGAVVALVLVVASSYHFKLVPFAVKAIAVVPLQYEMVSVTIGSSGLQIILTVLVFQSEIKTFPLFTAKPNGRRKVAAIAFPPSPL